MPRPPSRRASAPAHAEPPRLDSFLTWRLHQLHKLSDKASQDAYLADCGLPLGEARCLAAVGAAAQREGAAPGVNDLAAQANLDKGQASRAAQALIVRGLVAKAASATDGRGVVLSLTPAGQAMWQQVMALIARRNAEIFGCLGEDGQRQLGELLDRVIAEARRRG